ncbi:biotin carboxylase [Sporosarcina sp. P21c]|uniref:ATP-grasp domain-containing protein n=1 Tax=unclassified Sporosarcina TaxID=2647733 RepID=UPI000C173140|nr:MULTISPECIES: ATP-grasp domain-containing protein [unclassified Sporosarcina]PIC66650.1 biotin carboxylase [Sporosarcina sp. P16a]PIC88473.1 biotin carboxylase [Sporosarcina sp. P21c]PIC91635.1 biotin carboxylase [Sporosarcina sp. P25]
MNTILFVETTKSGSSREAIKAAERLGYATVLLTENARFIDQREEFPEVTQMIHMDSITEETIREHIHAIQKLGFKLKGIFSFVDPFVSMTAHLANEFCHSKISADAYLKMEDKALTRTALATNEATPNFMIFEPSTDLKQFISEQETFPLIVKSPFSKASRDVYLVEDRKEMTRVMKSMLKANPNQQIVIEEYLDGPQYLVELVVVEGKLHPVAVIKQDIQKDLKFIITGYEIQLSLERNLYAKLIKAVESICNDLGAKNVACHLELRYVRDTWKLIELNPRISGGAMNRMIEEAYGINLMEETLKLSMGEEINLKRKHENHIYTHYITVNAYGTLLKVTGKNYAKKHEGVREVYVKPRKGTFMTPPISMGSRYGYVIASGETASKAKRNALHAAKNIKFYIESNEE